MGRLTTHVLDTSSGLPAADLAITLWELDPDGSRRRVCEHRTNADGRVDRPILEGETFVPGTYELIFAVGDYFRRRGLVLDRPAFLDVVPLRFGIAEGLDHLHVPLLVAPYGYSTYRGS
ncbi:MAG: hydroxyisourate hydrolase [Siculibacillus sp.]|nr:hydroxyisourate hydrolase [Siculibacillus sp.]